MRWAELFGDLEAQFDAAVGADQAGEISDRTRRETALLQLAARLRSARGRQLTVRVNGVGAIGGVLDSIGPDWLLLRGSGPAEMLVPAGAVMGVAGLPAWSDPGSGSGSVVGSRLTLTFVLRAVVRDRSPVTLTLIDASRVTGTPDRVGKDFLEIAEHPPGEPRRRDAVRAVQTVPLTAVALVQRT